jgi:putative sterol carrier protein
MSKNPIFIAPALALAVTASAQGAGVFMDADWAAAMCKQWNNSSELTEGLAGDDWVSNNAGRGYKIIHLYRTNCGEQTKVELELTDKDGKAHCAYGGAVKHAELNYDVDYLMHAEDDDWVCMGEGKFGCGAMGAMMTGKLKFQGPKGEAMGVMGPFDNFLVSTGKVPGDKASCP